MLVTAIPGAHVLRRPQLPQLRLLEVLGVMQLEVLHPVVPQPELEVLPLHWTPL